MAGAPKGNKNALGNKGGGAPTFQDRELAARVRSLALLHIEGVLKGELYPKDADFHKALLLKLASTVLPRLNEHTGEHGGAIKTEITGINYLLPNGDNAKADNKTTSG